MRTLESLRRSSAPFVLALAGSLAIFGMAPQDTHVKHSGTHAARSAPHSTLIAFKSDKELAAFLRRFIAKARPLYDLAEPSPPPPSASVAGGVQSVVVTAELKAPSAPGITNNQEAGVDEGDIVKLRGDALVVLRRGRLFSVSLAGGGMKPIDSINAYPPGVDASDDWYDEMLIAGSRIVVIGYSYARGGTEINRFDLSGDGHFK